MRWADRSRRTNAEYLLAGADVVVIGEGELTLEGLIPHFAKQGMAELDQVRGIAYLNGDGDLIRTPQRPKSPTYRPSHGPIEKPSTWSVTCRPGRRTTACARPR